MSNVGLNDGGIMYYDLRVRRMHLPVRTAVDPGLLPLATTSKIALDVDKTERGYGTICPWVIELLDD